MRALGAMAGDSNGSHQQPADLSDVDASPSSASHILAGSNADSNADTCSGAGVRFPPPLTILAGNCCYSRFPYCMPRGGLRPVRKNGRFLLHEVRVPRQLMFHSVRRDGRLVLLLLLHHDDNVLDQDSGSFSSSNFSSSMEDRDEDDQQSTSSSSIEEISSDPFPSNLASPCSASSSSEGSESGGAVCGESEAIEAGEIERSLNPGAGTRNQRIDSKSGGSMSRSSRKSVMEDLLVGNFFCGASQWNRNKDFPFQGILPWTH